MQKTIEVLDNFYKDPMAVREFALRHSEWIQSSSDEAHFYGARTKTYSADQETQEHLFQLIGQTQTVDSGMDFNGFFTFTGQDATAQLVPHVHDTDLAAVIYLSLPNQCLGGISFYRSPDAGALASETDSPHSASQLWEETTYIPMRFNRLVIFRASTLYHRATRGFGRTPESGRLAQMFLFNELPNPSLEEMSHGT